MRRERIDKYINGDINGDSIINIDIPYDINTISQKTPQIPWNFNPFHHSLNFFDLM